MMGDNIILLYSLKERWYEYIGKYTVGRTHLIGLVDITVVYQTKVAEVVLQFSHCIPLCLPGHLRQTILMSGVDIDIHLAAIVKHHMHPNEFANKSRFHHSDVISAFDYQ